MKKLSFFLLTTLFFLGFQSFILVQSSFAFTVQNNDCSSEGYSGNTSLFGGVCYKDLGDGVMGYSFANSYAVNFCEETDDKNGNGVRWERIACPASYTDSSCIPNYTLSGNTCTSTTHAPANPGNEYVLTSFFPTSGTEISNTLSCVTGYSIDSTRSGASCDLDNQVKYDVILGKINIADHDSNGTRICSLGNKTKSTSGHLSIVSEDFGQSVVASCKNTKVWGWGKDCSVNAKITCVKDAQTCTVSHGTGTKTWNGTAYGSCIVQSCDTDYRKNNPNNPTSCVSIANPPVASDVRIDAIKKNASQSLNNKIIEISGKIAKVHNTNSCFDAGISGDSVVISNAGNCALNTYYTFTYTYQNNGSGAAGNNWVAWCSTDDTTGNMSSILSNNAKAVYQGNVCGDGDASEKQHGENSSSQTNQICKVSAGYFTSCDAGTGDPSTATVTIRFTCPAGQNDDDDNGSCVANNTAPTISAQTFSINENETTVGTITASDSDGTISLYEISGTDVGKFNINGATGVLTFQTAPDFETDDRSYSLIVTVTDDDGVTNSANVTVNVQNINEKPTAVDDDKTSPAILLTADTAEISGLLDNDTDLDGKNNSTFGLKEISTVSTTETCFSVTKKSGDSTKITISPAGSATDFSGCSAQDYTFQYRVKDKKDLVSDNWATVTISFAQESIDLQIVDSSGSSISSTADVDINEKLDIDFDIKRDTASNVSGKEVFLDFTYDTSKFVLENAIDSFTGYSGGWTCTKTTTNSPTEKIRCVSTSHGALTGTGKITTTTFFRDNFDLMPVHGATGISHVIITTGMVSANFSEKTPANNTVTITVTINPYCVVTKNTTADPENI